MNMLPEKPHIILIDWGTTNVRAFLFNPGTATVIDQRASDMGITSVPTGGYPAVYRELTDTWRNSSSFTLMAGMVGSANGWEEAPYTYLPASPQTVARQIHTLSAMDHIYIVGGLCCKRANGSYDVMRGEEVQIIGLLSQLPAENHLICLPGTHSKWLECDTNAQIDSFTTVMSGDFFSAVCDGTIMQMMLEAPQHFSEEVFVRGVEIAQGAGGIMAHMFTVRGAYLFEQIERCHVESMISGIVIGAEIYEMHKLYATDALLHVISADSLGQKYSLALESLGIRYQTHPGDALSLAGMAFLLGEDDFPFRQDNTIRS